MLTSVEGIYRNGRVELMEQPADISEGTRVIVTFVRSNETDLVTFVQLNETDLASQGIDRKQAEVLRENLATFVEDWDSPEMDIYNNYDTAKPGHSAK